MGSAAGGLFEGFKPQGWVVLSGAVPSLGGAFPDLADNLLQRIDLARPPLAIMAAPDRAVSSFVEEVADLTGADATVLGLGEESGYQIEEAGLIALSGGTAHAWLQAFDRGELNERLGAFLEGGGILIAAAASAGILGSWAFEARSPAPIEGLDWLPGAIILPGVADPAALPAVRELLLSSERLFALGLPPDTALAIGPGGLAEVWSLAPPKLVLGRGWRI